MATDSDSGLRHEYLNGWSVFWAPALVISAFTIHAALGLDLSDPASLSQMIAYAVRWSVPFIYLVVAASALPVLFPGEASRWLLRNRRYIGLVFAVAMAWQGVFIFNLSAFHADYYYSEVYYLRDELEGSSGYLFLAAMVITSFDFVRRHFSRAQWKLIHRSGTLFLWAYPFSVYWWNLYYYDNPQVLDHVFYWAGFFAFSARIAAWGKRRAQSREPRAYPRASLRAAAYVLIAAGMIAAATGGFWRGVATSVLTSPSWSASLALWLPFWPFEPFLPLLALGLGTLLLTGSREAFDRCKVAVG